MPKKIKEQKIDEIAGLKDQLQRLAAEFDNYRKRTEEEKRQLFQLAQAQTLLELAPVLDNFRRATEHLPEHLKADNWVTGVLYIEKQLEAILDRFWIKKIKTIGEKFDPRLHEAVASEAVEAKEPGTIIAEVESGYMVGETVLKPAKVKVSAG